MLIRSECIHYKLKYRDWYEIWDYKNANQKIINLYVFTFFLICYWSLDHSDLSICNMDHGNSLCHWLWFFTYTHNKAKNIAAFFILIISSPRKLIICFTLYSFTQQTILAEYRIHNADIVLKYDATADDLIDVIEGNRVYIPCIYLLNKIGN